MNVSVITRSNVAAGRIIDTVSFKPTLICRSFERVFEFKLKVEATGPRKAFFFFGEINVHSFHNFFFLNIYTVVNIYTYIKMAHKRDAY